MIKKIYLFNEKIGTLLTRTYENSIDNENIRKLVLMTTNCNFINSDDIIIFKKLNDIYICFIVSNENEFYILGLIDYFINLLKDKTGKLSDINILFNFKDYFLLLDKFIINGKIINLS